ncbi:DUF3006 domain-containing protein [Candidatus Bathycorpusculum sp.]|uniref:DUF3006 domain-containing protein n=1 Tax=Candidatus Bathycorpusculum sp. TaxID=2994959 RepID=UPI00283A346D|nr:DUF3006 domain-containing protein [Candidatus Termitimicrobium sp.]MCL2685789.1 DUF3006 domain-containing protein [Candidatus Termitimicrobium sp.]
MIIVDRIENGIAVCEIDGVMSDIPLSKISTGVCEGDVLIDLSNEGTFYTVDTAKTEQRRAEITKRFEHLKAKNKK